MRLALDHSNLLPESECLAADGPTGEIEERNGTDTTRKGGLRRPKSRRRTAHSHDTSPVISGPRREQGGRGAINRVLGRALDSSFTQLHNLDWDDITIFNRLQMRDVVPELERLRDFARTDIEKRTVERVIALANRCQGQTDSYLMFIGD